MRIGDYGTTPECFATALRRAALSAIIASIKAMILTSSGTDAWKVQSGGVTLMTEGPEGPGRAKPDIYLRTSPHDAALPEGAFVVKGPGEYEIREVEILGLPPHAYIVKIEDMRLAFVSRADAQSLEKMNRIDIAFVMENGTAATFLRQMSPRMIIASDACANELGKSLGKAPERMDKLSMKLKELPAEGAMKLICLTE